MEVKTNEMSGVQEYLIKLGKNTASNVADRESKLSVIESRLSRVYSAVESLEGLQEKIQGLEKPLMALKTSDVGRNTVRCLAGLLNELPDQLFNLAERIEKAVAEINSVIY